jgi:hypothetical protein
MQQRVIGRVLAYNQITVGVIERVTIYVVNLGTRRQWTAERTLCDSPVNVHPAIAQVCERHAGTASACAAFALSASSVPSFSVALK